ncbi:MAG: UDP-N-acetylmuramoyl-tripeptide--D-alanyl-D-alanine ligase [Sulfuricaulis sp.]|uniref:UDP-N-acetylmuramoyl-tripeptide--D-alanyl-D- alanine ligase n=1 Tax=Sulfuricaulis sp. TaxID=2003553 RepID=UPI0025FC7689|nr:UDP-N-acetylmuramoyl-tripeptide--D-alanyl-D-alanine ligase [Sulfuricaulis sp.]MCR4347553.1 UDP-N-acetylmuramoyl-tripeptide--D-alanyl-D-alanine ligase [Sulfuricaulis sp.]
MSLEILADVLKCPRKGSDAVFTGVSHDTRTLQAGDLYVAIKGDRFDGHNFLAEAISAGAVGALLGRDMQTPLPYVHVPNTRLAYGNLGAFWRNQFQVPVVAITGSNGKTTVKEMIGTILGEIGTGCVTRGNFNNDIGVPLTLVRMRSSDRFAVIEMGMNHFGEIEYLSRMTRPTVALITNAGEAHLAGVGTVEGVARAKGEIFTGLRTAGTAVLNADDEFFPLWRTLVAGRKCLTFGLDHKADVSADYRLTDNGSLIHLKTTTHGDIDMSVPLLGRHNVMNTLAGAGAAIAAGASLEQVKNGLEKLQTVSGRLEVKRGVSGARIIDDTYNANPTSVAAGLQVLKEFSGERVMVLGDMGELGSSAADIHFRVGELAGRLGIQRLFAIGEFSRIAVGAFGKGARHFESHEALIEALQDCLHADMTVLVKGSRMMHMEQIVAGITKKSPAAGENGRKR